MRGRTVSVLPISSVRLKDFPYFTPRILQQTQLIRNKSHIYLRNCQHRSIQVDNVLVIILFLFFFTASPLLSPFPFFLFSSS